MTDEHDEEHHICDDCQRHSKIDAFAEQVFEDMLDADFDASMCLEVVAGLVLRASSAMKPDSEEQPA